MTDDGVKDPLWRAIHRGLGRRLDPLLFERCAVDLLQQAYQSLVPLWGPGDGGMDGEIATDDGAPTGLVCTTSSKVIDNLTKNLKSHKASRGIIRSVVVATSRSLTPRRRRNLKQRADELGFALTNVHDRDDFVGRLYRSPFWTRELLGITGKLSALSAYPGAWQPGWEDHHALGRDEDLDWMRRQEDDYVLVGQPGVGKTALLQVLAQEGRGLFAVTDDLHRLANAYRESQPKSVFLPDAHLRADLLRGLLRLRFELGAPFKIAATTWPSREQEVAYDFAAPTKTVDPLPRKVVANIVRSAVGAADHAVVAEVLDQSKGKPELAVQLANAAIKAPDAASMTRGIVLLTHLERACRLSARDKAILTFPALGGEQGMTLANVAAASEASQTDVNDVLRKISGTGFLGDSPFPGGPLSIVPAALQDALVATTFFSGARSLNVRKALEVVHDATSAARTLISVLGREATGLRQLELHDLIRNRLSADHRDRAHRDLWQAYAKAGRKDAVLWILNRHKTFVGLVGDAALHYAPLHALPLLLARLTDEGVHTVLNGWLTEPAPDVVKRRRQVLDAIREQSCGASDTDALALVATVFGLDLNGFRLDRVQMNVIDWQITLLSLPQVEQVFELWPSACRLLRAAGPAGIGVARGIAERWCRSATKPSINMSREWRDGVRKYARGMVADVVEMAHGRPGILLWAKRTAEATELDVELPPVEPELEAVLPPYPTPSSRDETFARNRARTLASGDAGAGVRELQRLAEETQLAGYAPDHHRLLTFVEAVADAVADPIAWTRELAVRAVPPQWVAAFLSTPTARGLLPQEVWDILLENDQYSGLAMWEALQHGDLPSRVEECILKRLTEGGELPVMPWKAVHEAWKLRLLRSDDRDLATLAAGAMWRSDDLTTLSRPVQSAWLNVMAQCEDVMLLVDGLLSRLPMVQQVAEAWFLVPRPDPPLEAPDAVDGEQSQEDRVLKQVRVFEKRRADGQRFELAASLLDRESKIDLIRAMPAETTSHAFLALVGEDVEVYQALLKRTDISDMHLLPLRSDGAEAAIPEFVVCALRAGYSARDVAGNVGHQALEACANHADADVRDIAELVRERYTG